MTATSLPAGAAYPVPISPWVKQHTGWPYQLVAFKLGPGNVRQGVRLSCAQCGASEDVSQEHDCAPEHIVKKFQRRGWRFHMDARRCLCPACTAKPPKPQQPTTEQPAMAAPPQRAPETVNPHLVETMPAKPNGAFPPKPPALQLQQITTEQRVKIRGMLDSHFDDARGADELLRLKGRLHALERRLVGG